MSTPTIPDISATIDISIEESINLLLASIAFEELGLAHIVNAEAEKLQFVLGKLDTDVIGDKVVCMEELLEMNRSIETVIRTVAKKEMLLQWKLEDVMLLKEKCKKHDDKPKK